MLCHWVDAKGFIPGFEDEENYPKRQYFSIEEIKFFQQKGFWLYGDTPPYVELI